MKSGKLARDEAQALAVSHLQDLHDRLAAYRKGPSDASLFAKLFFKLRKPAPQPCGLYLCGDVGRGKSMLMDMFFQTAPLTPKRRVHFHEFMLETHERIHAERQRLSARTSDARTGFDDDPVTPVARTIAGEAKLLCFDEFQVNDITDAMILGRLFRALYGLGVVVVATSNRAPDALYEGGLNRQLFLPFLALFKARQEVVHLGGEIDYRQEKTEDGDGVYFTPLDEKARAHLDHAFAHLTHGHDVLEIDLPVAQGRTLLVPAAADGTARFSFSQLCERPLSAADYLTLAGAFHTLVLDDIPQMGPHLRNEARRFVTLIDTLYENKTRLICSAAVAPDALYAQGDGSFEFARTVSRLAEMQSADYLAAGRREEED